MSSRSNCIWPITVSPVTPFCTRIAQGPAWPSTPPSPSIGTISTKMVTSSNGPGAAGFLTLLQNSAGRL